ncbi:MAG TPA: N-acetyltransferase [Bryobacteraceae bacterium]|nr:N-acetyltransferase [Bryobacteraceae bacterium]
MRESEIPVKLPARPLSAFFPHPVATASEQANYKEYSMSLHFAIRLARPADLDRILEIENASFGSQAYDRRLFAYYLKRCGGVFLVASRGGVCGYMITCLRGRARKSRAELVSVAIDPLRRHAGAASALLDSTLRRLRRYSATGLHLVVRVSNKPARALYRKYQFRRVRVLHMYYEDGSDGIAMSRPVILPKIRPAPWRGDRAGGRGSRAS